jgi:hypothetical protein
VFKGWLLILADWCSKKLDSYDILLESHLQFPTLRVSIREEDFPKQTLYNTAILAPCQPEMIFTLTGLFTQQTLESEKDGILTIVLHVSRIASSSPAPLGKSIYTSFFSIFSGLVLREIALFPFWRIC